MSDRPETAGPTPSQSATPEPEWMRRRRLAEIFGDVLPDTTSDERDRDGSRAAADGSGAGGGRDGGESRESAGDRWLREQVPPHHGS